MLDDWSMNQSAIKKCIFHTLSARMFLENAAHVHCTARAEFEQSSKWFGRGHEYIVPYIIDLEPFKTLPGPEMAREKFHLGRDGQPTVLFLSRLHEKKGIEHLLRAAATLRQDGFRGQVVIAGAGEEGYVKTLHEAARGLNLGEQVKFVGQVKGAEKLSLYEASDLFVLPTSQENFGLVLVEALACGTPLVTTKGVDIWRDVEESGAARVVERPDRELAGAMQSILTDEGCRRRMASAARPWVFKTYDQDRLAGEFARMYQESLRETTPRSATVIAG
jgi:glycosyltransferase involved in cell wall biosynthesis